jgi:WD40 repeat protein
VYRLKFVNMPKRWLERITNMKAIPTLLITLVIFLLPSIYSFASQITTRYFSEVAWSPDGTKIAVGSDTVPCNPNNPDDIQILNAVNMSLELTITGNICGVTGLAWSPDGSKIGISNGDPIGYYIWDSYTGEVLSEATIAGEGLVAFRWNPNGSRISVGHVGGGVSILDPLTGQTLGVGVGGVQ